MKFTYAPGDRPLEGYTLKHGIGRGGFGEVYHAVSDGGKEVALKLVQRNLEVELRGVGQCLNLKHPNLVSLYDVRQAENGDNWVVMEHVAGESLDQVIARHPQGVPPGEVLTWLRGIGEGIAYLHGQGIVHRDLKPGNLFVENGAVKIGDYGLSKFISASRRSGQTGSVGTVHYMAPEVVNGRYGKEVDLYALGVILYEMLTGRVPFDGQSPGEVLMKHMTAWPDLNAVPLTFRPTVARLLEKDPQRRYPSVRELLAELDGNMPAPSAEAQPRPLQDPGRSSGGGGVPVLPSMPASRPAGSLPVIASNGGDQRIPASHFSKDLRKLLQLLWYLAQGLVVGPIVGLITAAGYYAVNYDRFHSGYPDEYGRQLVATSLIAALCAWAFVVLFLICRAWVARLLAPFGNVKSGSVLRLSIAGAIGTGVGILSGVLSARLLKIFGAADERGIVFESQKGWLALGLGLLAFGISAWSLFFVFGEENLKAHSKPAPTPAPTQTPTSNAGLATGPWQPQGEAPDAHPIPARR
jgi:serine/threonine protein kinase